MKYVLLSVLALAVAGLSSCKHGGYTKTKSGLEYIIHTNTGGKKPKEGDFMKVYYQIRTDKDSILEDTRDPKSPYAGKPVNIPYSKPKSLVDLMEGFGMLGEGDSATFRLNSDSIYKMPQQRPPFIKAGEYMKFIVKMVKLATKEEVEKDEMARREEAMKKMKADQEKQLVFDDKSLQDYFSKNNLHPQKTASGLYYTIETPGKGDNVGDGDSAVVNYAGRLLDGKLFDTNMKDVAAKEMPERVATCKPFTVAVGAHRVIPGWDEGLKLFKKGAKGKLYIPSTLAYGPQANGGIPSNSCLVFDVMILDIKHTK